MGGSPVPVCRIWKQKYNLSLPGDKPWFLGCPVRSLLNILKGKAVPLQAESGSEGSWKLRFPDFITKAQDGGKVVNLTHRPPLPPGNAPGTHFC